MSTPERTAAKPAGKAQKPVSVLRRRWRKFRTLKRGWYSFLLLLVLYLVSFANPLLINSRALIVKYDGQWLLVTVQITDKRDQQLFRAGGFQRTQ